MLAQGNKGMISEKTIDMVRNLPITEVLKSYTKLERKGSSLVGVCPFHAQRTGSFSVSPSNNLFHCFSCHKGGDGISFIMEKENLSFNEAVEFIARNHNISIERIDKDLSDEEKNVFKHKEALLVIIKHVHEFFIEAINNLTLPESSTARQYAYSRWPKEFCIEYGIGYAPKDHNLFQDYIRKKSLDEDLLIELGILKKPDNDLPYPFFRERLMIPIKDRFGRPIGFTGRYLGTKDKIAKYLNSPTSLIYTKVKTVFGIDKAYGNKEHGYLIIVEGAPDVLRLHSLGFDNSVAALGTTWSESQFEQIKRITESICYIPDTDIPKDKLYGPGFESVMRNGCEAIRKGFNVTVRELPFSKIELSQQELKKIYPYREIFEEEERYKFEKNDADNYIKSKEDFYNLEEKHFIVWYAEKKLAGSLSNFECNKWSKDIAELLIHVKDRLVVTQCINQLVKLWDKIKAKDWKDLVNQVRKENARTLRERENSSDIQNEKELLKRHNLFIRNNCYFTLGKKEDEEPIMISNFIMEPLFHIEDDMNAIRLFTLINNQGDKKHIELKESELCSLTIFQQRVGSLGNFLWSSKIDKLNQVKGYLYAKTATAERIKKLGWDENNEFYSFGNGIYENGKFLETDDIGIVKLNSGKAYYLPATSRMYRYNQEIFQFERLMIHQDRNGVKLREVVNKLTIAFGPKANIAFCYLLATLFRDIIYSRTRHFPILNLFGEKGTGKTTLATCLQSFFLHGIDPPNLSVTSVPAMNDMISEAVNMLVIFDEYKNDLDIRKIGFLKGLWGGGGQTKKNLNTDGKAVQTMVTTGVVLCGQEKPTQDMALFTRLVYLSFSKTSFTLAQRQNFENLVSICGLGLTHLTLEILNHRKLFENNFSNAYTMVKQEISELTKGEEFHDRILGNWVILLATFRTLESVIDFPVSYNEMLDLTLKGMREQNDLNQESSEIADFWSNLQGLQISGKFIEETHYRIKYLKTFRPIGMAEDIIFKEAKPILFLNADAVSLLFSNRSNNVTSNRSNWSTMLTYLKTNDSYLGLKQTRFTVLSSFGYQDKITETVCGVSVQRKKTTRPKALCFEYSALKEKFGIDFETEIIPINDD